MNPRRWKLPIGARPDGEGVAFRVWAPGTERVDLVVYGPDAEMNYPLQPEPDGYFAGRVERLAVGTRYRYRLDGGESYPDPASRSQPEGVHGPSEVIDPDAFAWSDADWPGRALEELVIYELHVGTFTPEGTFDGAIGRLRDLANLGVTAIEVMPIANFPGERNWGYDGVNLYAPATAYGGADAFKRLVDAAHGVGLSVILDVVYNHLGPEGNYLPGITRGRFFTERHKTPWGDAVNYDGPDSGPVRDFVLGNALHWVHEYHVDGLRLDATHAIMDDSALHLLRQLAEQVHAAGPQPRVVIAEDERNERLVLLPTEEGGFGLDAVWADDLHHHLRRLAAGDSEGYFASYTGTVSDVAKTLRQGWFYEGQVSPHSGETRGTPADGIPPQRFVHCLQNHDQVGNRAFGDRLTDGVEPGVYRALSALLLLSPYTPLLWMGQEWAATAPFLYFTDHPEELGKLVTEGRREEFGHFSAFADPEVRDRIPDPQSPDTFDKSKLRWEEREIGQHAGCLALYGELLRLRNGDAVLRERSRDRFTAVELGEGGLALRRDGADGALLLVASFGESQSVELGSCPELTAPRGGWSGVLSTEEERFGGTGKTVAVFAEGTLRLDGPGAVILRSTA